MIGVMLIALVVVFILLCVLVKPYDNQQILKHINKKIRKKRS